MRYGGGVEDQTIVTGGITQWDGGSARFGVEKEYSKFQERGVVLDFLNVRIQEGQTGLSRKDEMSYRG